MMITNLNDTSDDYAEKIQRCQDYVVALEEERRKIQVFQRELPLCLELVTQAIEACKQQMTSGNNNNNNSTEYNFHGQSECSGQTSSEGPVLEEFIPIKRASSSDYNDDNDDDDDLDEEEQQCNKKAKKSSSSNDIIVVVDDDDDKDSSMNNNKASKKSDWLRSVQLWSNNQSPDPTPLKEVAPRKVAVMEVKRSGSGGAFHPFKREKSVGTTTSSNAQLAAAVPSSSAETGGSGSVGGGGGSKKEEKEGINSSQRKQRRCWSPELHRRFLQALQQLGGSHVATPKQIRELMKVDGLTNDEVKSHLQKYRLHTRRPSGGSTYNNNATPQAPQFVVVGGIWVPPAEYAAAAAMATPPGEASQAAAKRSTSNGIYAPIATPLPPPPRPTQEEASSSKHDDNNNDNDNDNNNNTHQGRALPNSPTTSSSDTTCS